MNYKAKHMVLYNSHEIDALPQLKKISFEDRFAMRVVSSVLPFRTNNYIIEELIDWDNIPADPIYQLTFMHKDLLREDHYDQIAHAIHENASPQRIQACANAIRLQLNPNPSAQKTANIPMLDEQPVPGVQHKYRETCLIFPSNGQTCHAYCTYCFRWPQFTGINELKFATDESQRFSSYLKQHKEITDVLITGGDPMTMSARKLSYYLEPLLDSDFDHIQSIRIGTKSVAYWPYRYVTDKDADDVLRLFEKIVTSGKHLALMAHYSHWRELSTSISLEAVRRIRSTGAIIRTQSPIVKHVNDNPQVWARLWNEQVHLGCVPYYMFIARDTGASHYFALPLHHAYTIFCEAYRQVSGLARTVRGPCMSSTQGKVIIEGIATIHGEKFFVLTFLQARDSTWCKRPFFARFDSTATWFDQLQPAFDESTFFFEDQRPQAIYVE